MIQYVIRYACGEGNEHVRAGVYYHTGTMVVSRVLSHARVYQSRQAAETDLAACVSRSNRGGYPTGNALNQLVHSGGIARVMVDDLGTVVELTGVAKQTSAVK